MALAHARSIVTRSGRFRASWHSSRLPKHVCGSHWRLYNRVLPIPDTESVRLFSDIVREKLRPLLRSPGRYPAHVTTIVVARATHEQMELKKLPPHSRITLICKTLRLPSTRGARALRCANSQRPFAVGPSPLLRGTDDPRHRGGGCTNSKAHFCACLLLLAAAPDDLHACARRDPARVWAHALVLK